MSWQKCPVCNGTGIVSGGYFARAGDSPVWASYSTTEICRVCNGQGIVDDVTGRPPATYRKVEEEGNE